MSTDFSLTIHLAKGNSSYGNEAIVKSIPSPLLLGLKAVVNQRIAAFLNIIKFGTVISRSFEIFPGWNLSAMKCRQSITSIFVNAWLSFRKITKHAGTHLLYASLMVDCTQVHVCRWHVLFSVSNFETKITCQWKISAVPSKKPKSSQEIISAIGKQSRARKTKPLIHNLAAKVLTCVVSTYKRLAGFLDRLSQCLDSLPATV